MNEESALITGILDLRMDLETAQHITSLEPDAFSMPSHRTIWASLQALVESGKVIDPWNLGKAMAAKGAKEQDVQLLDRYFNDSRNGMGTNDLVSRVLAVADAFKRRLVVRTMDALVQGHEGLSWAEIEAQLADISGRVSQAGNPRFQSGTDYTDQFERFLSGEPILPLESRENLMLLGVPTLDEAIFANPGRLIVIGALPSAGKTAIALQAAIKTAHAGRKVIMTSLEMDEDDIAGRVVACVCSVNSKTAMKRGCQPKPEWREAIGRVKKNLIGLHGCAGDNWQSIEAAIVREHRRAKSSLVIVDYLQLMGSSNKKNETEAQAIGEITKGCKRLAQKLGINVVLVSQFNRNVEEGREPNLQNFLGSGQIERDIDIALLLWNDTAVIDPIEDRLVWCRVAKNRGGDRGGKFALNFKPALNQFSDSAHETTPFTYNGL